MDLTQINLPLVEMTYGSLVIAILFVLRAFWITVRSRKRYRVRNAVLRAAGWLLLAVHMIGLALLFFVTSLITERGSLQDIANVLDILWTQVIPAFIDLLKQWPELVKRLPEIIEWIRKYWHQTFG